MDGNVIMMCKSQKGEYIQGIDVKDWIRQNNPF